MSLNYILHHALSKLGAGSMMEDPDIKTRVLRFRLNIISLVVSPSNMTISRAHCARLQRFKEASAFVRDLNPSGCSVTTQCPDPLAENKYCCAPTQWYKPTIEWYSWYTSAAQDDPTTLEVPSQPIVRWHRRHSSCNRSWNVTSDSTAGTISNRNRGMTFVRLALRQR